MKELDFTDAKTLEAFAKETVQIAEEYQNSRVAYGDALRTLKLALAKSYKEGTIKETISEDKSFVMLSNISEEYRIALETVVTSEQEYKGLEKLIDARQAVITLFQSIIKNQKQNG
jgi:hypothetical protein